MGGRSKLVHGVETLKRILGSILCVPPPKIPSTQIRLDRDRKVSFTKSATYPHSSPDQTPHHRFPILLTGLELSLFRRRQFPGLAFKSLIVPTDLESASHLYRNAEEPKRDRDALLAENVVVWEAATGLSGNLVTSECVREGYIGRDY